MDISGAGDAFIAGFSVKLLETEFTDINDVSLDDLKKAIDLGCQAAFLNISRYGAGISMPTR